MARNPFFARLLAGIAKVEKVDLDLPFTLAWKNDLPVLLFNLELLSRLDQYPTWLADWLEEELLHLVLAHPMQRRFDNQWAFHWAADLEAWQYHSIGLMDDDFETLLQRLHLTIPFTLQQAYDALVLQVQAAGQNTPDIIKAVPLSRAGHKYWLQWFYPGQLPQLELWRKSLRPLLPHLLPDSNGRFSLLTNLLVGEQMRPYIHWSAILRRFVQSGQRNLSQSSLRRPSKRYHTFPGTRRVRRAQLAIIIDTSGSIDQQLRAVLFKELQQLYHIVSTFDIIEADHMVRKVYPFTGEVPALSHGGGATNFDPALQYVNQQKHYDGVIYLTDGAAPPPKVSCRFPLLWLLTTPESDSDHLPGTVTCLSPLSTIL